MSYPEPQPNQDPAQQSYWDPAAQQSYPHPYPPAPQPYPAVSQPYSAAPEPYPAVSQPYPAAPGQQPYQDPGVYQPFPGMAPYPGGPVPGASKPPQPVMNAFYLMLAGAVLTLISTLYGFTQLSTIRDKASESSNGALTESDIDTIANVSFGVGVAMSLISIGLWIWMAFMTRAGKNWARITSTVFFGLYSLSTLIGLIGLFLPRVDTAVISTVFGLLTWSVGLGAVILLWNKQARPYFRPAPAYPSYPGQYPSQHS
ncbi:hypothetical protein [Nocardia concava]|uniref:hypothetical protein n=1 Tax=Nocardia concava TaxID=257281 RepID=UPI000305EB9D|nr:hypothetical protein [Nocardia concava]